MTDINAAAARRKSKLIALISCSALFGLGLGGCGTGGSPFGGGLLESPEQASVSTPAQTAPAVASKTVAIAPIIGAPDTVAKQLGEQMGQSMAQQRVAIAGSTTDKSDYTVRGYVVAAREKANIKVSYIWDVTDPTGKRVNRVTGEELIAAPATVKDPWSVVTPQVVMTIANKSSTSLGTWLNTQATAPAIASATPAAVGSSATPSAEPPNVSAPQPSSATQPAIASAPAPITPASIGGPSGGAAQSSVAALVPTVSGAPGDGGVSLTGAIQRELTKSGVSLTERSSASAYVVEGKVKLSPAKDGKQTIEIDWKVKDPKGKSLGTVTQKNEVPQGSLDGAWGKTAEAAAAAAAQGIVKLLPGTPNRVN